MESGLRADGEKPRATILISANSGWNILNFRANLIRALIAHGYRVIVAAPGDAESGRIVELGAEFRPFPFSSSGLSPLADSRVLLAYYRLLREIRPDFFLGFTAKPNIYGSIAAQALGIPTINNITGLGTAFLRRGILQALVAGLYRAALRRSARVFFQNEDDRALFVTRKLVRRDQAGLLAGSGIDLEHFAPRPLPPLSGRRFRFLLVARMLRDKGVGEFVAAARIVNAGEKRAEFVLLGPSGADNRTAISTDQLNAWAAEGVVEILGPTEDVRPHLAAADCVVLPSYREGLPRSLIEAAAMARPVITTDVPGCRAAIDDGTTGLLCAAQSAESLAAACNRLLEMSAAARRRMGQCARDKAVREFDERHIHAAYLAELDRSPRSLRSSSGSN